MKSNTLNQAGLTVLLVVSMVLTACQQTSKNLPLITEINGQWTFREAGQQDWMPAVVPGTVHTDLLSQKIIKDPFSRLNENDVQWVENKDWEYKTSFNAGPDLLAKEVIFLNFKGLDTYADVYLNEQLILNADNMFVGWEVPCKEYLVAGENELRIYFHSPVKEGLKKLQELDYLIPAINEQAPLDQRTNVFTRKAPFHFGWDWGPRLVTSGVWRPVFLEAWSNATVKDVYLVTESIADDKASLSGNIEIHTTGGSDYQLQILVNGHPAGPKEKHTLTEGVNEVPFAFSVDDPKLWWTNGLGEPHLYAIEFVLEAGGKVIDRHDISYGIRTLKLVQKPDTEGFSFYFELNGVPVFMKGANVIPSETLTPAVSKETYENMIASAADAHMNMLRVWGGAIYEEDLFYDLCDQNGILIWQDFMFACNLQPGDTAHLNNIRLEAEYNVKRLRNHASIALWCGNNENLHGWHQWGWKEMYAPEISDFLWWTYERIFYEILPAAVQKYDPKNAYWSSSPSSINDQLADRKSGDEHDWTIWFGQRPFSGYEENVPRFVSEWGMQAFPNMHTIKGFTEEEDREVTSEVMRHRQRSKMAWVQPGFDGNDMIGRYMEMYYNVPDNFEDFVYVSQLLQAKGYATAIEAHRRAMPWCMGSLYWQLNDCWPTVSWSTIDYHNRWKASHYAVKKANAEIMLSTVVTDESVQLYAVSDRLEPTAALLGIKLMDFDGKEYFSHEEEVIIPANVSTVVFDMEIAGLMAPGLINEKMLLYTTLKEGSHILAENTRYFTEPKSMLLSKTDVPFSMHITEYGYKLKFESDKLIKNLFVDCPDADAFFSDNYFDVIPGNAKNVEIRTIKLIEKKDITLKYLNNL